MWPQWGILWGIVGVMVGTGLGACGYSSVAGRVAPGISHDVNFQPFVVRNATPDLILTHVVNDALRSELARRGLFSPERRGPNALYLNANVASVRDQPASYAPGRIIEYRGDFLLQYSVVRGDTAQTVISSRSARLQFRYDYNANPQVMQQYRQAAIGNSVRDWVSTFILEVGHGIANPLANEELPAGNPSPEEPEVDREGAADPDEAAPETFPAEGYDLGGYR